MTLPTVYKVLLIAWLGFVAVYDLCTWTVPAWSTWPVTLGAAVWLARTGSWAPLGAFVLLFLADTSVGDFKRLFRASTGFAKHPPRTGHRPSTGSGHRPSTGSGPRRSMTAQDDRRWLLPPLAAGLGQAILLHMAWRQGSPSLSFTLGFVLVHALWYWKALPGGDAALLIALTGVFPDPRFLGLCAMVMAVATLPRLAWKYRGDFWIALKASMVGGVRPALAVMWDAIQHKARPEPVAYIFSLAGIVAIFVL